MSGIYGFVATDLGRALFAKLAAGTSLEITRVAFGSGALADGATAEDMKAMTGLVAEGMDGTSTDFIVDGDTVSCTLELRNDLNGGLAEDFWIREFGVFASDPDLGEILILYGNLGDYPDALPAYETEVVVRDYPITVTVSGASSVVVDYTPSAFVTSVEVKELVQGYLAADRRIVKRDITIPAEGWEADTVLGGVYIDIALEDVTADMVPAVNLYPAYLRAAKVCGLEPCAETTEGILRLYAASAPAGEMLASLTLVYAADGTAAFDAVVTATAEETDEALDDVFSEEDSGSGETGGTVAVETATAEETKEAMDDVFGESADSGSDSQEVATAEETQEALDDVFGESSSGNSDSLAVSTAEELTEALDEVFS